MLEMTTDEFTKKFELKRITEIPMMIINISIDNLFVGFSFEPPNLCILLLEE